MHIPVVVAWSLIVLFAVLAVPAVHRLAEGAATWNARETDLAELCTVVAMVAMVSPLGGPIPAAGWQAVLVLVAGWFAVAATRGRRNCFVHHAICAAAMLYMLTAMPRHAADHGPWIVLYSM